MRRMLVTALVMVASANLARPASAGQVVYLSIGDSVAFGETDFSHNPSDGNRGYVSLFAQTIAARDGGIAPKVINLAIDGETTSSLSSASGRVPPVAGIPDSVLASLNTHYTDPTVSQYAMLVQTIQSELAKGDTIGNVTISLGANDLFALALSPAFNAPGADQAALLAQTLGTVAQNYGGLLTAIHLLAPNAQVALLGEYNPFPGDPTSPFAGFAAPAIQALDGVVRSLADTFGARYVDTYTPFVGHEAAYTHIADNPPGNVHPNDLGYSVIAGQIAAATAVPEPASIAMLGVGMLAAAAGARRLGRAA